MVQHTPENMIAVLNEIVRTVRVGPSMRVIHANEKNIFGWINRSRTGDPKLIVRGWPQRNSAPMLFHECVKLAQKMHWQTPQRPTCQQWRRSSADPLPPPFAMPIPPPPFHGRQRLERVARKAALDGFKDAAFENAIASGDPRIPAGVADMGAERRRSVRNAWWQLAVIDAPELLVMAGSNSACPLVDVPVEAETEAVADEADEAETDETEAADPAEVETDELLVPYRCRSIEHAARISLSLRITTRLKNPNVRFKYQSDTAEYARRFLPSDNPTLEQMQDAYNEIGRISGHSPENIIQKRYEMIKNDWRYSHDMPGNSDLHMWWKQRSAAWLANADSQLPHLAA